MDFIKLLLRKHEGEDPKPHLSGYSKAQMPYRSELMEEDGLLGGLQRLATIEHHDPTA
jgi:hypothetical protein